MLTWSGNYNAWQNSVLLEENDMTSGQCHVFINPGTSSRPLSGPGR
jgi:hypothetical protein